MDQGLPAAAEGEPTGPPQQGRGVRGQYVYWIVFSHPKPETAERLGIKVPTDFDRKTFSQLVASAHQECGVSIVETASFQEPHTNGLIHHNCLVRSLKQCRWAPIAALLRAEHKVCVAFGSNIKTGAEGVGLSVLPPTPTPLPKRDSIGNRNDSEAGDCCKPNNHPPKHIFNGNHTDLGVGDWVIVGFLKEDYTIYTI